MIRWLTEHVQVPTEKAVVMLGDLRKLRDERRKGPLPVILEVIVLVGGALVGYAVARRRSRTGRRPALPFDARCLRR